MAQIFCEFFFWKKSPYCIRNWTGLQRGYHNAGQVTAYKVNRPLILDAQMTTIRPLSKNFCLNNSGKNRSENPQKNWSKRGKGAHPDIPEKPVLNSQKKIGRKKWSQVTSIWPLLRKIEGKSARGTPIRTLTRNIGLPNANPCLLLHNWNF